MRPHVFVAALFAASIPATGAIAGPNLYSRLVESSKDCVEVATRYLKKEAGFANVKTTARGNVTGQVKSTTVMVVCEMKTHVSVSVAGSDEKLGVKLADGLGLALMD